MAAKNMAELEQMIMKEMKKAMNVASNKALADMHEETGGFYTQGNPSMYERTGALGDTPRTTAVSQSGNSVSFKAYLDTSHRYSTGDNPSMEDVLNLANYGQPWSTKSGAQARATVGKKGFWERAKKKMGNDFYKTFSSFFK